MIANNLPDIALVRTYSDFEWDHFPRPTMLDRLSKVGASVMDTLGVARIEAPRLVLSMTDDTRIGRTAYYLEQALAEHGQETFVASSRMLSWEIDQSRLSTSKQEVAKSLARVCTIARGLSEWDENSRLVVVTSEPFIQSARAFERGTQVRMNDNPIEPGQVVGVRTSSFGIK